MTFVETEQDRRRSERTAVVKTAQLDLDSGSKRAYILDLSATGFRSIVDHCDIPTQVSAELLLSESESVQVTAIRRWSVKLDQQSRHCGFEISSFREPEDQVRFQNFLETLPGAKSQGSGMAALRSLNETELRRLSVLAKASRTLNSSLGYSEALEQVIEVMCEALGAERGLLLLDRGGRLPAVEVARGPEALSQRGLAYSETLVQKVLKTGQPILSLDVSSDQTLDHVASLQILGTVSVLCVPLRSGSRSFGLIYLDSSIAKGLFNESDLILASIIADLAAAAIERSHFFNQAVQAEKMAALGTLVAGLAHELVNPLSAIKGLGECWRDGESEAQDPGHVIEQADRCLTLVKDLLSLSRGGNVVYTGVSLHDIFEKVESLTAADVRSKKLHLTIDLPQDLPLIRGNSKQLVQVFLNLLTNAIALLPAGGTIEVMVTTDSGFVRVSVMDNGEGIPVENLKRIFDPFVTTRADGHGLGLSIIQRLVQDHGGMVMAKNRPDGGAIFTVELPTLKD